MSHGGQHDPLQHLNDDHADDLLAIARTIGGRPDATAARSTGIDRDGIELTLATPSGRTTTRVEFDESVDEASAGGLRAAFAQLTWRARPSVADNDDQEPERTATGTSRWQMVVGALGLAVVLWVGNELYDTIYGRGADPGGGDHVPGQDTPGQREQPIDTEDDGEHDPSQFDHG